MSAKRNDRLALGRREIFPNSLAGISVCFGNPPFGFGSGTILNNLKSRGSVVVV